MAHDLFVSIPLINQDQDLQCPKKSETPIDLIPLGNYYGHYVIEPIPTCLGLKDLVIVGHFIIVTYLYIYMSLY
jgi:hypothetical protein